MRQTYGSWKMVLAAVSAVALWTACGGDDKDAGAGGAAGATYGLRGQVLEAGSYAPIVGLEVSIGNDEVGWVSATTDDAGWWQVDNYSKDATRVWLQGAKMTLADRKYPSVRTAIHEDWLQFDSVYTIPRQKYLPRVDEATSVDVSGNLIDSTDAAHPAAEGWRQFDPAGQAVRVSNERIQVVDPDTGNPIETWTYFDFEPGTFIKFPEGAPEVISITQLPVDQLPHTLPTTIYPDTMLASQPGGTLIDPPLRLHFGEDFLLGPVGEPGTIIEAWTLLHSQAAFVMVGEMEPAVGDMGPEVTTKPGEGLTELGWHGPGFQARPQCNPTSFEASVDYFSDGQHLVPDNGVITMTGRGEARNVGSHIATGRIDQCNGNFRFEFMGVEQRVPWFSAQRFAQLPAGGTLCLGKVTVDAFAKTLSLDPNGACN